LLNSDSALLFIRRRLVFVIAAHMIRFHSLNQDSRPDAACLSFSGSCAVHTMPANSPHALEPESCRRNSVLAAIGRQWGIWTAAILIAATYSVLIGNNDGSSRPAPETKSPHDTNKPHSATSRRSSLAVDPAFLNFGEALTQETLSREFLIRNDSDLDVAISGFKMSCSCTSVTPGQMTVPAHQSAAVQLAINLTHRDPEIAFQPSRAVSTTIIPILDDPSISAPEWTFTGKAISPVKLSATSLVFARTVHGAQSSPKTFVVVPYTPDGRLRVECDPRFAAVRVFNDESDEQKYTVEVSPDAALESGRHTFSIAVQFMPAGANTDATIAIPAEITVSDDIQCEPPTLLFGNVTRGQSRSETISVFSLSRQTFLIDKASCEDSQIRVDVNKDAEFRSTIRVILNPASNGTGRGELLIEGTGADGTDRFRLTIPYYYRLTR